MKKIIEDLPDINRRIKNIIDTDFNGNVLRFSKHIGLSSSSKINRLFNKDKRSGNYPDVTTDIILLISNALGCSTDSIIKGSENEHEKHVNNITIDASRHRIDGEHNVIAKDSSVNDMNNFMEIIKVQQEQINKLLEKQLNNG